MEEVWKDIEGYEGLYQVSNLGRVKNVNKNIIKKSTELSRGYLRIGLNKHGKTKKFYPHRLVAQAFIPNPKNKPCVNHKDCNPKNNCVDNLEWCTHKYNNSYKNHHLKRNISSTIYYLKRDYPNEIELIELAQQIKNKINLL